MIMLTAVTIGLGAGAGVLLVVGGVRGNQILPRPVPDSGSGTASTTLAWTAGAGVAGLVVFVLTGWPVAGVAATGGVWWVRRTWPSRAETAGVIPRTEAIAVWAEQIRDNMTAAAGLEQALLASAAHAPAAIGPEVARFASRIERMPLLDALAELGDDLDHPSSDLVVVALANAVRMEARDLAPLLTRLALFIRSDVRMRLRIEVSRARIRTSARIVIGTTVVTGLFLFLFSPNLLDAYDSPAGQAWLCVVIATFAAGAGLLRSFGTLQHPGRFSARRAAFGSGGPIR